MEQVSSQYSHLKSLEFWLISSMLSSGLGGGGGVEPLLLGSGFPAHQGTITVDSCYQKSWQRTFAKNHSAWRKA